MLMAVIVGTVVLFIIAKVLGAIGTILRGEVPAVLAQREECWGGE